MEELQDAPSPGGCQGARQLLGLPRSHFQQGHSVVGQMSTTKAPFPRFALSLVEAETGRREETVCPQVCQS